MKEIFEISAAILTSLGGGAIVLFAFSNFLGKLWANRFMEEERAKHALKLEEERAEYAQALEEIRAKFQNENQQNLAYLQGEIDVLKETTLREHNDKLAIYRVAMELIAVLLVKLEMGMLQEREFTQEDKEQFQIDRLKVYAQLALTAPQEIMDANDKLIDHIVAIIFDDEKSCWEELRGFSLDLVNAMRKDIGIDKSPVSYNGSR